MVETKLAPFHPMFSHRSSAAPSFNRESASGRSGVKAHKIVQNEPCPRIRRPAAEEFRKPIMHRREQAKSHRHQHIMKVGDTKYCCAAGVRRSGECMMPESAIMKSQEPARTSSACAAAAAPQGCHPVEDLHAGRNGDGHGGEGDAEVATVPMPW